MRIISYRKALQEALSQIMESDSSVIVLGEGVDYKNGIFGSTEGLIDKFGSSRVIDTPLSEDAITGIGIGAALMGLRPVMVHARTDFLLLCMNQLVNHAAKWQWMCGGYVPIVVRAIIGRGWGQGAQHSQSLQSLFAGIPGLKVIMPATAYDAKGMLISAIRDPGPVVCIEHRWLYEKQEDVPSDIYEVSIGSGRIIREGNDLTIVALSYMVYEALEAARELDRCGVSAEVVDLRAVRPIDSGLVIQSVRKTGRLIVVDTGWKACGVSAEVSAIVAENISSHLLANVVRVTLPDYPTPSSKALEQDYYPGKRELVYAGLMLLGKEKDASGYDAPTAPTVSPVGGKNGPF